MLEKGIKEYSSCKKRKYTDGRKMIEEGASAEIVFVGGVT